MIDPDIPIHVVNSRVDMFYADPMHDDDPFADDTPLVCGLENPEICESCT